jgi:hypothetical protein
VLKRLASAYGLPPGVFFALAIAGLVAFWAVFALATHSGLAALWPELPSGLVVSASVLLPLVFLVGVGIACAKHDQWMSDPRTARTLKLVKWLGVAAVVAFLAFQALRMFG